METALNEITLVLFTTIAPAGVMGYLTMALAIVLSRDEERAAAISRYLVVPLVPGHLRPHRVGYPSWERQRTRCT